MSAPTPSSTGSQHHLHHVPWHWWLRLLAATLAALALLAAVKTAAGQGNATAGGKAAEGDDSASAVPEAPKNQPAPAPLLDADLATVPELHFQEPFAPKITSAEWKAKTEVQVAKMNKLNQQETDGFWKALLAHRPDLAGLPVLMGDGCRMPKEQLQAFSVSLAALRLSMMEATSQGFTNPDTFATTYKGLTKLLGQDELELGDLKLLISLGIDAREVAQGASEGGRRRARASGRHDAGPCNRGDSRARADGDHSGGVAPSRRDEGTGPAGRVRAGRFGAPAGGQGPRGSQSRRVHRCLAGRAVLSLARRS